jgi:hypothetical protein
MKLRSMRGSKRCSHCCAADCTAMCAAAGLQTSQAQADRTTLPSPRSAAPSLRQVGNEPARVFGSRRQISEHRATAVGAGHVGTQPRQCPSARLPATIDGDVAAFSRQRTRRRQADARRRAGGEGALAGQSGVHVGSVSKGRSLGKLGLFSRHDLGSATHESTWVIAATGLGTAGSGSQRPYASHDILSRKDAAAATSAYTLMITPSHCRT